MSVLPDLRNDLAPATSSEDPYRSVLSTISLAISLRSRALVTTRSILMRLPGIALMRSMRLIREYVSSASSLCMQMYSSMSASSSNLLSSSRKSSTRLTANESDPSPSVGMKRIFTSSLDSSANIFELSCISLYSQLNIHLRNPRRLMMSVSSRPFRSSVTAVLSFWSLLSMSKKRLNFALLLP